MPVFSVPVSISKILVIPLSTIGKILMRAAIVSSDESFEPQRDFSVPHLERKLVKLRMLRTAPTLLHSKSFSSKLQLDRPIF